jgi:hypothetical protein
MICPLCGHRFTREQGTAACAGCPLARGCNLVRCPRCGYETVAESRLGRLLRKLKVRASGTER